MSWPGGHEFEPGLIEFRVLSTSVQSSIWSKNKQNATKAETEQLWGCKF